ncbi:MAG: hypothetical protein Q9162_005184 [Coniocarpon cinnabarinum]
MLTPEPQEIVTPPAGSSSAPQVAMTSNTAKKVAEQPTTKHVHHRSGYQWEREEDAPGYAWKSKRAFDEIQRSYDSIVQRDNYVGARYGDPALIAPADTPWEEII